MITSIKTFIVYAWNFVFNHNVSPLRHIPDVKIRHLVLQILGFMWAVSFSIAIGSYTVLAASILGHLISVVALSSALTPAFTALVVRYFFSLSRKTYYSLHSGDSCGIPFSQR